MFSFMSSRTSVFYRVRAHSELANVGRRSTLSDGNKHLTSNQLFFFLERKRNLRFATGQLLLRLSETRLCAAETIAAFHHCAKFSTARLVPRKPVLVKFCALL